MNRTVGVSFVFSTLAVSATLAGGSISSEEVQTLLQRDPKLKSEVKQRLKGSPEESISCTSARVGRDVAKEIGAKGGARIGPYDCNVGQSKLKLSVEPEPKGVGAAGKKKSGLSWKWE